MKIYTKINYQWLDDKLVKTSSNSFEYTGELSLCNGLGQAISSATSLGGEGGGVLDPIGTTTDIIDKNTDSLFDSEDVQDAADKAEDLADPHTYTEAIAEGISTGTSAVITEADRKSVV